MKVYSIVCLAMASMLFSCSGSKTQNDENTTAEDWDFESTEVYEEVDEDAVMDGEFVVKPLTTDVEGALAGIVTIKDKTYTLREGSGLGDSFYALDPEFEVVDAQKFDGTIDLYAIFYDEEGNPVSFEYEFEGQKPYSSEKVSSFSTGFLQMAIAKDKPCKDTSVLIRIDKIKDFSTDMLKNLKTFKIFTSMDDYEFDYDSDLY